MVGSSFEEDNNDMSRRAIYFEVVRRRGRGRLRMTQRRHVVKQTGLKEEDAIDKPKWRNPGTGAWRQTMEPGNEPRPGSKIVNT